jgi:hypothetical protein
MKNDWSRRNEERVKKHRLDFRAKHYDWARAKALADKKKLIDVQRGIDAENARQSEIMLALSMAMK